MSLFRIALLLLVSASLLWGQIPEPQNITATMRGKVVPFAIGMFRLAGSHEITAAPAAFQGKPTAVCDRGDSAAASPAWSFTLPAPARLYLSVLRRGTVQVPSEWEKTGLALVWKTRDGSVFTDDIYTRVAPAGPVAIPGHEGILGNNRGVPHLVIVDHANSPVASGGPSPTPAPENAAPISLWVEAESFAILGGWGVMREGKNVLATGGIDQQPKPEETAAQTVIDVPRAGQYTLWVRSVDYANNQPATRRFAVTVNGAPCSTEFGSHRQEGLGWQKGGEFSLKAGENHLALLDTTAFFARCDKFLLTTDTRLTPKGMGDAENVTHRSLNFASQFKFDNRDTVFTPVPAGGELATLQGGDLRLSFQSINPGGEKAISPAILTRSGQMLSAAQNQYFVWLGAETSNAYYNPRTSHAPYFNIKGTLEVNGAKLEGRTATQNPFLAASVKRYFYGSTVVSKDAQKVVLSKETPEFSAVMTWSFSGGFPTVDMVVTPKIETFATVGAYAFAPLSKEATSFFLLPYHWQAKRWPESILLMPSAMATTPISLMETRRGDETWSFAVAGDIKGETMAWPSFENSIFALAIQNEKGQVQPGLFAPVPATKAHWVNRGKPIRLSYALYAAPKTWNGGFDDLVSGYFGVKDIRRNWQGTLHDAALNMFDLIMNDQACGWMPKHMGFSQIENKNTVSQSSLLMALEQYWLTGDEAVWDRRALPTAAFLFSRGSQHFATHPTDFGLTYVPKVDFQGPVKLYGTSTYQGMHEQFRGRAPVFFHDALKPDGSAKLNNGYNSIPEWSETYYAYRLTGDKKYLEAAVAGAREYIASNIARVPSGPRGYQPFVKLSQPPYFWAFVDLYEETKDPAFLDAAKIAADYVLTTLFIHPYPFQENYQVTRQGAIDFSRPQAWWKGDTFFRLGFEIGPTKADHPPTLEIDTLKRAGDIREELVPAWVVSPLGVSIEQPSTMARARVMKGKGITETPLFAIRQNCEVAYLMRLWGLTKEKRYWTFARNGILGQFNNYPGYYINLMSTTERTAEYPFQGPDLSDIYYHHIPVHLAFTVDFLFTAAETRSGGRVKFPSVLQQGYVWFINRMVGHRPGDFYSVKNAQPLMRRDLFALDSIAANVVTAASPDTFCMLFMNEEETNVTVTAALSDKTLNIGKAAVSLIADNGTPTPAPLEKNRVRVSISPKGVTALIAKGVSLKDRTLFQGVAKTVDQGTSSFIREDDPALGARIQAALFAHPVKDQYDAFINTDLRSGSLTLSTSADGRTWQNQTVDSFPYEGFVRVSKVTTPFQFKLTYKDPTGKTTESSTRTLKF